MPKRKTKKKTPEQVIEVDEKDQAIMEAQDQDAEIIKDEPDIESNFGTVEKKHKKETEEPKEKPKPKNFKEWVKSYALLPLVLTGIAGLLALIILPTIGITLLPLAYVGLAILIIIVAEFLYFKQVKDEAFYTFDTQELDNSNYIVAKIAAIIMALGLLVCAGVVSSVVAGITYVVILALIALFTWLWPYVLLYYPTILTILGIVLAIIIYFWLNILFGKKARARKKRQELINKVE